MSDSEFWAGQTETALRCLLHADALDGRRAIDLYRWSLNPVLAGHPKPGEPPALWLPTAGRGTASG